MEFFSIIILKVYLLLKTVIVMQVRNLLFLDLSKKNKFLCTIICDFFYSKYFLTQKEHFKIIKKKIE